MMPMDLQPPNERRSPSVQDAVRNQFDPVAANYAASAVHAQGDELAVMVELAELTGAEKVLDAGCGPGHTALTFALHAQSVVGVDLAPAMLAQGRRLAIQRDLANVDFREGDVQALPFEDGIFDLVVSRYSAHHWPEPARALSEFRRVLRKDGARPGRFLLADVVTFDDPATDTHFQSIELLRDPSHVRDHRPDEWLHMLTEAGFDAQIALTWDLHIDFASWIERMRTPDAYAAQIRALLANAPSQVRENLRVEENGSFSMRCALFSAQPENARLG